MTKSRKTIASLLVIIMGASLVAAISGWLIGVPRYYSLTRNARLANGTVTSKEPGNHMSVWYEYKVDGRTYRSAGSAEDIGKTFDAIQVGEQISVYYDQSNPASALSGDPQKYLYESLEGVCFVFFGVIILVSIYFLKRGVSGIYGRRPTH